MRLCVLKSGGDYGPRHVQWLASQVPGLQCLSDIQVEGVPTIPLRYEWPGWFAKLELFRPDIEGDILYFDLDTVVTGPIDDFDNQDHSMMLTDFYYPARPGSGLMYIKQHDKAAVWDEWITSPEDHMARCNTKEHWGDQGFLRDTMPHKRWQDALAGQVVSYKAHCRNGLPKGANVVCFHGQPRPWQVKANWIPTL